MKPRLLKSLILSVCLAFSALSPAFGGLSTGLLNYWNFEGNYNDIAGTVPGGSSTNPDDGTPADETKVTIEEGGPLDKYGAFNLTHVVVPNSEDITAAGESLTISAWFTVTAFTASWQALIAHGEGSDYRIARRGGESVMSYAGGVGDIPTSAIGPDVSMDGEWHHVVAISEHGVSTRIWVDGELIQEGGAPNLTNNGSANMWIGSNPDTNGRDWNGNIDDIGMWDRALTEAEIGEIYTQGRLGKPLSVLVGLGSPTITILGTGTSSLIGGDLTDPENNGNEAGGPTDPSWNWESITSNNEPGFDGGELAFNIFDNRVGGGADKWCCDDPTAANPWTVDVKFGAPVILKSFTITSGNDARDREPLTWQIAGSNDGTTWTPIFVRDDPTSIWTDINQVAKVTLGAPAPPYLYLRYQVSHTAGPLHQLNEIEYFGDVGGTSKPTLTSRNVTRSNVRFNIKDGADTTLVGSSVVVKIDNAVVPTVMEKNGNITSYTHTPSPSYAYGSIHPYEITGEDNFGNDLRFIGQFTQPTPWLPEEDLPGPPAPEGGFATRYIFGAGTIDSIPSALAAIMAADTPEFTGSFVDVVSEVANHGNAGLFGNPLPYAQEATDLGCCGEDFILLHIGHIRIEEEGDYTFGVHSDDGFALRIRGGTAISESGNGDLDAADPEAVVHPANTGDSNTRGVYHLKPGVYRLEFFWWERGGGDHGELYVAKGSFANDGDTTSWKLVGVTSPATTAAALGVDDSGWSVISSDPGGDELTNWEGALADLAATAGDPVVYDTMNIGDPQTNGGVLPFPKNGAGDENDFAFRGTAKLVVPRAGTYLVGFNSDDGGYVKITGQTFTEILVNGTGASVIDPAGDQVICDCLTGDSNTQSQITLAQGTYDIEVGMFERGGGAYLRVSGAEVGAPVLPTLIKGGARIVNFPAGGVALTDDPVTTGGPPPAGGSIAGVEVTAIQVIITYDPASGTTARVARSLDLKTWTTLPIVPAQSGSNLIFTIPRGTEPAEYYRVLEP
ncbi:MAG: LamG-like jellyroll fold domain-containing protein [Verrucomicrobiales bacterium]